MMIIMMMIAMTKIRMRMMMTRTITRTYIDNKKDGDYNDNCNFDDDVMFISCTYTTSHVLMTAPCAKWTVECIVLL